MSDGDLDVAEDHRLQVTDKGLRVDVQRLRLFLTKRELSEILNFDPHIFKNYNKNLHIISFIHQSHKVSIGTHE